MVRISDARMSGTSYGTCVLHVAPEAAGVPALLYVKHDGYIEPADVAKLHRDGLLSAVKYATVRDDPAHDFSLRELVAVVDPAVIVSGIGEQPAIVHMRDFGLGGFTTGCGCLAPSISQAMLAAIHRKDWTGAERLRAIFEPLVYFSEEQGLGVSAYRRAGDGRLSLWHRARAVPADKIPWGMTLSPDGRFLAVTGFESATLMLYAIAADGGLPRAASACSPVDCTAACITI
jgi:hypothetical protein